MKSKVQCSCLFPHHHAKYQPLSHWQMHHLPLPQLPSPPLLHILLLLLLPRLVSLITRCWNWGWSSHRSEQLVVCCVLNDHRLDWFLWIRSGCRLHQWSLRVSFATAWRLHCTCLMSLVSHQWVAVNWWWHPWLAGHHSLSSSPRSNWILLSPKWHCSKLGLPSPFTSSCFSFSTSQKGSHLQASTCSTLVASLSGYWQGASQESNFLAMRSHPSHFGIKKGNLLVSMEQKL